MFEYSNKGVQMVSPNLTVSFVQPLLRGAWARNVTQGLSLQERAVLYNLRGFAEFRRQFYVSFVTGRGHSDRRRVILLFSTSFRRFATWRAISNPQGRISRFTRLSFLERRVPLKFLRSPLPIKTARPCCSRRRRI